MPTIAEAIALGWKYHQAGDLSKAEQIYRQVLQVDPRQANVWCLLATAFHARGQFAEAVPCYQEGLRLRPTYAEAHSNLGIALAELSRFEEALKCFQRAIQLKPDYAGAHNNIGKALRELGRLDEAQRHLETAVRLQPDFSEAHNNLGLVYHDLARLNDSLASYGRALALKPGYAEAHKNRALVRMLMGNFAEGCADYEWRWQCHDFKQRGFQQPLWDGSVLDGRTILLHAEQGLGDTIQFARYAPLVKQRGGRVVLECFPPLMRLLASCPGIDQLVVTGSPLPPFDVHAPLMSLHGILFQTVDTLPADIPYLAADATRTAAWQQKFGSVRAFKIGIVWQGNTSTLGGRQRAIPLSCFEQLSRIEGVQLYSLQKGAGAEQLRARNGQLPIIDLSDRLDETAGPFMDTAAVMKNLDLVIAADTAIPHLAGALGVRVWTALQHVPDWRWFLEREDTPWYPTMRLFRQRERGNWEEVFARMAHEVQLLMSLS